MPAHLGNSSSQGGLAVVDVTNGSHVDMGLRSAVNVVAKCTLRLLQECRLPRALPARRVCEPTENRGAVNMRSDGSVAIMRT
jgi:hypothetical protein